MSVRFGAFEVDLEGRRLLKRGIPIALREQSFQVLAALMESPGEIVTREELRRRLWSSDTFVDFEVALNSAVSRLRDALGDSAESPSFIETVPKRGYRFVVSIPKRPAVAVMPFANQTGDARDEYFSDGLTDGLIRVLSRIDVTAGSVVYRFKGQRREGTGRRSCAGRIAIKGGRPYSDQRQSCWRERWLQPLGAAFRQ
jgi:DNA-binding winged helix-turn-helix (wHTH) protein